MIVSDPSKLLDRLITLVHEGIATFQVPHLSLDGNGARTSSELSDMGELFKEGVLVWVTPKQLIFDAKCKNPDTGRTVSGALFLSPTYAARNFDAIYKAFEQANATTQRIDPPTLTPSVFIESVLDGCKFGKHYANALKEELEKTVGYTPEKPEGRSFSSRRSMRP
jgi:hypothetical protein